MESIDIDDRTSQRVTSIILYLTSRQNKNINNIFFIINFIK